MTRHHPSRILLLPVFVAALVVGGPALGQTEIRQTDWTGGPGAGVSLALDGETAFDSAAGHALHDVAPGALRAVQFTYRTATELHEVVPVRVAEGDVSYYAQDGAGGTPIYPAPECLISRFWLYRDIRDGRGDVSWFFHVNVNGAASDPCAGGIDATYTITPGGVATLAHSDDAGESTLAGFAHSWLNEWADGHVIRFGDDRFTVRGTIDSVDAVTEHRMYLDEDDNYECDDNPDGDHHQLKEKQAQKNA